MNDNAVSRREKLLGLSVLAASFILAAYFLFDTLVNPYVINHDAMLHIFWMQSFRDPALFRGDLSAECARYFSPAGITALYRLTSFAWDPLAVSKVVPVFVFSLSAYYVFKLVRVSTESDYCGLLGAAIFMFSPCFMHRIVGGHARAFGFLFLSMALYYIIKKKHRAVSLVLISQCLFYPVVFLSSVTVYAASLVSRKGRRLSLNLPAGTLRLFFATVLACGLIVAGKYAFPSGRSLGAVPTREQLAKDPVVYQFGRPGVYFTLPLPSLYEEARNNLEAPFAPWRLVATAVFPDVSLWGAFRPDPASIKGFGNWLSNLRLIIPGAGHAIFMFLLRVYTWRVSLRVTALLVFYVFLLGLGIGLARRRSRLPRELFFLLAACIAWYYVAGIFKLRLYLPSRYLEYPLKLIALVFFCAGVGVLTARLRRKVLRRCVRACLLLAIAALFFNMNKSIYVIDLSGNKQMYRFCATLPADTVIAGHPQLINGIPLFSHRRAFVNFEPSYPYFAAYWKTISKRTDDFFAAYYSGDFPAIDRFCSSNKIGWLIVDESHFSPGYLAAGDFYFQPFNSRVAALVDSRRHFALMDVPPQDRNSVGPGIFAVRAEAITRLAALNGGGG